MARGDHICVRRLGGLYTHHGIDLGDGTVVHLSGEPFRWQDAVVCRVPIEEFLKDGVMAVVDDGPRRRSADEVVRAAIAAVGESGYHLWRNNCEHFASECATGRKNSQQVTFAKRVAKVAAGVAAAAIVVAGAAIVTAKKYRGRAKSPLT